MNGPFASREAIYSALWNLLTATTPAADVAAQWNTQSRDLVGWEQVVPPSQPALFMVQTAQHASNETFGLTQWKLSATVWIYYRTDSLGDPTMPRDKLVNEMIDVIEKAIAPPDGFGLQSLGGLVQHTYIDGTVVFDSGLTDPQAVI